MAASSMRDIRTRIKSVESTRQITKAMQLVASSKMAKAKLRMDNSRAYFGVIHKAISEIVTDYPEKSSIYINADETKPTLLVVVGGDRGLAGGYNSGVIKLAKSIARDITSSGGSVRFLPVGKKMRDHFAKTEGVILPQFEKIEQTHTGEARVIGKIVSASYKEGEYGKVILIFTKFRSMLSQEPVSEQLLPIVQPEKDANVKAKQLTIYEPGPEVLLDAIVPQYVSGVIYGACCEAFASECAARRSAMDSATKNADAMIDNLSLQYNRARQAAITQELTEIVSGANAL